VEAKILPDDHAENGGEGGVLVSEPVWRVLPEHMPEPGDQAKVAVIDETPDHTGGNVGQHIGQEEDQPEEGRALYVLGDHSGQPQRQGYLNADRDEDDNAVIDQRIAECALAENQLVIFEADPLRGQAIAVPVVERVPGRFAHRQNDENGKEQQCRGQKKHQYRPLAANAAAPDLGAGQRGSIGNALRCDSLSHRSHLSTIEGRSGQCNALPAMAHISSEKASWICCRASSGEIWPETSSTDMSLTTRPTLGPRS
jgi:hypothetical protein